MAELGYLVAGYAATAVVLAAYVARLHARARRARRRAAASGPRAGEAA